MPQKYKRPPITEAVVEFRFTTAVERPVLDKLQKKLLEDYPLPPMQVRNLNVEVQADGGIVTSELHGYRLTATDGASLVVISPKAISTSRLAPYTGWEVFMMEVRRNWEAAKSVCGWRPLQRVGVRYINRIDIPVAEGVSIKPDDYFSVFPQVPLVEGRSLNSYALNITVLLQENLQLILNTSTAPNTLVNHLSFILDLDLSKAKELPQGEDQLWDLLERIRRRKNELFESCITERSRTLFL